MLTLHLADEAHDLARAIVNIIWHNAMMIEIQITRYLGKKAVAEMVDYFCRHDASGVAKLTIYARFSEFNEWW